MIKKTEELDLIQFQKDLNDRFSEINNQENEDTIINAEELILEEVVNNHRFIFPLKNLQHIVSDNKVESIPLTKSFITGFNQVKGEIFTIIDFRNLIDGFLFKKENLLKKEVNSDSNIIYLKEYNDSKIALVINMLSLKKTSDFELIYEIKNIENNLSWEKIGFNELEQLENYIYPDKIVIDSILKSEELNIKIMSVIDKIYWDKGKDELVFSINVEGLTLLLNHLTPF